MFTLNCVRFVAVSFIVMAMAIESFSELQAKSLALPVIASEQNEPQNRTSVRKPLQILIESSPPNSGAGPQPQLEGGKAREYKHSFRIGLIVPRTAFSSQYKTYTQRIKDTFSHLLQLSRNPHQSRSNNQSAKRVLSNSVSTSAQTQSNPDSKPSSSSCLSSTSFLSQQHNRSPWQNLTFNQYFDIKVVDLANLAARSSAQDVIETMCHKLIEQNVSVIVYLENNQDETVTSFESPSALHLSTQLPSVKSNKLELITTTSSPFDSTIREASSLEVAYKQPFAAPSSSAQPPMKPNNGTASKIPFMPSFDDVQRANSQAHFIMHLAQSAGIPMIAWSVTATLAQRPKKQRTLHLAPTVAHEAEAMMAILQRYSWHSFSVVSTSLAGHDDFILALRQNMAALNNGQRPTTSATSGSSINPSVSSPSAAHSMAGNAPNISVGSSGNYNTRGYGNEQEISTQPSKTFKLLDVIIVRKRTPSVIEEEVRKLTVSESRVILLYATKGEAIDILRVARRLNLTKKSYAWIVAQSTVGPNENERAPPEFHPGLLGIYFRSNHERLLDELSRAITIIAHGLEQIVRDKDVMAINNGQANQLSDQSRPDAGQSPSNFRLENDKIHNLRPMISLNQTNRYENQEPTIDRSILGGFHRLLSAHSRCHGSLDELCEKRGDYFYEYFRKSSPFNTFDAGGSLKNVQLNVINLGNDRHWRKIGCFSDATLNIDDITWPEQAERPPSGTMEKFHLRAVFLEEPSFVNLAEPDAETGECKTNRAVRCHYKVLRPLRKGNSNDQSSTGVEKSLKNHSSNANRSQILHKSDRWSKKNSMHNPDSSVDESEYKCCSGFCIDLMEKFATDLKFSYDLYRVPDGYWGILENNTWNGLIGEITGGRADVIVTSIKINSDRQKAVDFTIPFLDTGISILVSKQTGVIAKLAFLEPFDTLAWIMFICVGIPIAAMSIFYFEWLSPSGFYAKKSSKVSSCTCNSYEVSGELQIATQHLRFSFCRTLWLVITILFGSAAHIDSPKGYTARFMSNVWATFAVVFLAVYTANLAAFMITREEYLELSGIDDSRLAYPYHRNPSLKFGTITGGNTHAVLNANKPNLYNYMRRFNRPTVEDGVDAVRAGHLDAFIYDALVLDYLASQDPECKLINVGSWYSMTGYALAFPRNSRYYDKFNMKMLDYRKNGELDRLRRFWLQGLCKPGQNRHSISKPLDLSQFMSAFLLLGAGILCSVFVLVMEHLYIIYIRDKLIKSRYREQLIRCLYPFSLSLTDTLRLPEDEECRSCCKCDKDPERATMKPDQLIKRRTFGTSSKSTTSLELENLSKKDKARGDKLDVKMNESRSWSNEILNTHSVARKVDGSFLEGNPPRTTNLSLNTHVPEISGHFLEALRVCELSLENELGRVGQAFEAYSLDNDLRHAQSLLGELKRVVHKLSNIKVE